MNKENVNFDNGAELDALFSQARAEQPALSDTNFTKVVVNRLPTDITRSQQRTLSFDLIAVVLALIGVYFFTQPLTLFTTLFNTLPGSVTLSPSVFLIALTTSLALSAGAWWAVEKKG